MTDTEMLEYLETAREIVDAVAADNMQRAHKLIESFNRGDLLGLVVVLANAVAAVPAAQKRLAAVVERKRERVRRQGVQS